MEYELFEKRSGLITGAALFLIAAGLIHLFISLTGEHSQVHGIFLALAGIAETAWGFAFLQRPSAALYRTGMILAGWLITLWILARFLPVPFGHGREAVDISGIICTSGESLSIALLAALAISEKIREGRIGAWRSISSLLLISLILAGLTYSAALAVDSVYSGSKNTNIEVNHMHKDRMIGKKKKVKEEAVLINSIQEINLTINASGYYPDVIIAGKGILLKLNIHSEENAGCASTIVFPDFGINKTVPAGKTDSIEINTSQEGTFGFRCSMDMAKGELVVK